MSCVTESDIRTAVDTACEVARHAIESMPQLVRQAVYQLLYEHHGCRLPLGAMDERLRELARLQLE